VTDVSSDGSVDSGAVKLVISLTEHEPPVGTVAVEGADPIAFSGWLGLVNLLGGVVDSATPEDVSGASLGVAVGQPTELVSAAGVTADRILRGGQG
jgi:hypothetical protein